MSLRTRIEDTVTAEKQAIAAKNRLEQIKFEAEQRIVQAEAEAEADKAHAKFKVHPSDFLSYLKIWEEFNKLPFKGKEKDKKNNRSLPKNSPKRFWASLIPSV